MAELYHPLCGCFCSREIAHLGTCRRLLDPVYDYVVSFRLHDRRSGVARAGICQCWELLGELYLK